MDAKAMAGIVVALIIGIAVGYGISQSKALAMSPEPPIFTLTDAGL